MQRILNQFATWGMEYCAKPILTAGGFVLVALLWSLLLQQLVAYPFVFLFFGAIMGAAWFGGFLAGLWSIVFSSALVDFFFMPPLYSIHINQGARSYQGAFMACAIAISAISAARRRAERAERQAREQLEVRVEERTAELKLRNRDLLERERELRTLAEAIPQQIWRANAEASVEYSNRDLMMFTGRTAEQLRAEGFFAIFHPLDVPVVRICWESAQHNRAKFEIEARVAGADGAYRWFLVRGTPQLSATQELLCWYGVHIDIEEKYRADEALRVAQGDQAQWARTLSMAEMAATIAHELKQPLTALVAQAQACRRWLHVEPANVERAIHVAENLVRESTRAGAVIDRVRALFVNTRQVGESLDLNRIVRETALLLRDEALRRGISIAVECEICLEPVAADAVQIQQLLMNLSGNAMDAMELSQGERKLTLRTASDPCYAVRLSVLDTGPGITPETSARMFEAFYTTKQNGMGIGLAICRSIAEAHDGKIWAERLQGTTAFHVGIGAKA